MSTDLLGASLHLALGLAVCLLALLILRQGPGERLYRATAAMLFFGGLGPVLGGIGQALNLREGASPLLASGLITGFAYVWSLFFPSLLLFALVFPRERAVVRRFPRLTWLLYAPHGFHLLLQLLLLRAGGGEPEFDLVAGRTAESFLLRVAALAGGLGGLALEILTRFHIRFFSLVNLVFIGAAILLLARSLRGLRQAKLRRQLKVVLFGLGSCTGLYAVAVPVPTILGVELPAGTRMALTSAALLLGTGSIGFAIVRRGFLDIGTVVRRAILFSTVSGGLVLLYFLTVRQADRILAASGLPLPLFQILFVILVIVFFHPLLGRMEEAADRMLAGERLSHRNVIRRLGREMTAILDLPTLAATVSRTLKEALAVDRADLVLRDPTGARFQAVGAEAGNPWPGLAADGPLVRGIGASEDPVLAADLLAEIDDSGERSAADAALRALGLSLLVPVRQPEGGGCIGFLSLGPKVTGGRFTAEEATLLGILATQVEIAVRNARLAEEAVARRVVDEELALARAIQESILPQRSPELAGVEVAGLNVSSRQVGGDYYDLIPMAGGRLGIAIGDVSGKGIPAALLMSMLHAALHAQMNGSAPVHLLVERMNRILCRSTTPEKFASFFLGVYDPGTRRLEFTNGGHNYPILIRRDATLLPLRSGGLILGVEEDARYGEEAVDLAPGDLIVFYTDGVT
ncbi:MAG: SpoIIE family protein phosphatase, partial [Acidobacteria bacterium]|nr:SpoIIE family protein phosphatase [Acidobacteriota bacterium]